MATARKTVWNVVRWPLAAIAVLIFGAGVPYLWVWVGSQLQGGTAPSFSGLGVALFGIIVSYGLMAYLLAWIKAVVTHDEDKPVRHDWNRSLSAERRTGPADPPDRGPRDHGDDPRRHRLHRVVSPLRKPRSAGSALRGQERAVTS